MVNAKSKVLLEASDSKRSRTLFKDLVVCLVQERTSFSNVTYRA